MGQVFRLGGILLSAILVFGTAGLAQGKDTLVVAQLGDAVTLDPHANNGIVEASMCSNLFDTLVVLDKKMNIQPGLAEKWENPDKLTWVFHLRRGVKFHNGAPLTATDVKYSIERILNWKPFGNMGGLASYIAPISNVRVVDDYTVRIETKQPYGAMLRSLRTAYIMNKSYTEKIEKEKGIEAVALNPMGTGAFKLVEWVRGDRLTLARNDSWWGGKVSIPKLVFRQISNDATRVAALLSGEVDIATELPVRDVKRIQENPSTKVVVLDGMRTVNFKFDTGRDKTPGISTSPPNPLKDRRVRMAIYQAIDEDAIVKVVMNGYARPANQFFSDSHFGYNPTIQRLPYDPEKAKKLLAEAGYPQGFPLRVDSTNNRYVNDEQICMTVAQMLNKVGIKATCNARPKQVAQAEWYNPKIGASMFIFSFVTPTADAGGNFEQNFHTPDAKRGYGTYNEYEGGKAHYSNRAFDLLVEAASTTNNEEERLEYLQAAALVGMNDIPIVPLHYQNDIYGMSKKVQWNPRLDYFLTLWDATLTE